MNSPPASSRGTRASRTYRLLLKLYPAPFRHRHEGEMLEIFELGWRRAQIHGAEGRVHFGLRVVWDLARTVPRERAAALAVPSGPAPLVLGAFLLSFFLPAYGTDAGWRCAAMVAYLGVHPGNALGFAVAWLATASNLGVPLILGLLARPALGLRLARSIIWVTLAFAGAAGYFFWDFSVHGDPAHPLTSGYYVWASCQLRPPRS